MAHGTPDWGGLQKATAYPLVGDLGELADRLGAVISRDRAGDVFMVEDFRSGFAAWHKTLSGTGAAAALTTLYPRWGPYCVRLTGGSDGSRYAWLNRFLHPEVLSKWGLEASIAFITHFEAFYLRLDYYDGTNRYQAEVGVRFDTLQATYKDSDGNEADLGAITIHTDTSGHYHVLKMVVDFTTNKYVRFYFDQTEYDLSTYNLYSEASAAAPVILTTHKLYSRTGHNDVCQVDGIILTQDEP